MPSTGDGGWVLKPTTMQHGVVPPIRADYVKIITSEEGKLMKLFLPADAVDESVGDVYLQPRLKGETYSRSTPIELRQVYGGYEFTNIALFSVEDGKLLFAGGNTIESFEVFQSPPTQTPQ
jgi:hypothetical protein